MTTVPSHVRRFSCPDCKHVHNAWAPRCFNCHSLKGLELFTDPEVVGDSAAPAEGSLEGAREAMPRPRLVIARADSEPELTDPGAELVDFRSSSSGPVPITEIPDTAYEHTSTGLVPLDYVLGGGLVAASVVLLASPRGIGKTSLSLQMLAGLGHRCLYVSGEETLGQVRGTAGRVGALTPRVFVLCERELAKIFAHARSIRAKTIVIDSIQKMRCDEVNGRAGSPAQLKECTAQLVDFAKNNDTALWLIGHVTSDGDIQGPKTIEHEVDVVLELIKGEKFEGKQRILRCLDKNRFGPSDRVGHFKLMPEGLIAVDEDGWDEEL